MVNDFYSERKPNRKRSIPESNIVTQRGTSRSGSLSEADLLKIAGFTAEFNSLGLIRETRTIDGMRTEEELDFALKDAAMRSLGEEDINPDYHDANLDEKLMDFSGPEINPLMRKFEEYEGLDYNPAFVAGDNFDDLLRDNISRNKREI